MKITKKQLKQIIKEELGAMSESLEDRLHGHPEEDATGWREIPADKAIGAAPYVIERVGQPGDKRFFVKFVNTGRGYEAVWGSFDDALKIDDKMRALSMEYTVVHRTGYQTTINGMG